MKKINMQNEEKTNNTYSKKSIVTWVLICLFVGVFAYGLISYFFFAKNGNYSNNLPYSENQSPSDVSQSEPILCTQQYDPVCGVDGKTYSNDCVAKSEGIQVQYHNECVVQGNSGNAADNSDNANANQIPTQTETETDNTSSAVGGTSDANVMVIPYQVTLEADDYGFYPISDVVVSKGSNVELTFKVRTSNVYYGGLDFRSLKFNTGQVKTGESIKAEFVADESFVFTSYWPLSGVMKATGKVIVE